MKRLAGLLVLFSAFAIANEDDPGYPYTLNPGQMADHLDEMDLSDGVSKDEAGILAVAYYFYYGGLSGAAMPVEGKGDWWHSETMVDPGGKYAGDIRIHRKTGIITWERGQWTKPPYTKMKAHLRSFQKAIDKDD